MARYALRRLALAVPVFVGAIVLLFAALYLLPSDPAQAMFGLREVSPELRQALNERYGFDDPFLSQVGHYLANIITLDFGESAITREPVRDVLFERIPTTLRLAAAAAAFMAIFGILGGVIAGAKRSRWTDASSSLLAALLVSIPVFVIGLLLQVFVAIRFKDVIGLPATGLDEGFRSYILPGFTLAAASIAYLSRVQRASLIEAMSADHIRTARAKGLTERQVVVRHAWPNSLIPVVTFLGIDIGAFMGGAVLTESVFNINGLGRTIARAIEQGDNQVVLGGTAFLIVTFIAINLLIDLSYSVVDPRVRYE